MSKLREEFQKQQESKFSGTELLFETSNEKYINWLEQIVVNKNDLLPDVSNRRELFDKFYAWLDGLTQGEYDDMSLTDKCEKFFFKT